MPPSYLTLGEALTKPKEAANSILEKSYLNFFTNGPIELIAFELEAAKRYADIQSRERIRPVDAIQLACAAAARTDLFVTNDNRLSGMVVSGINFAQGSNEYPTSQALEVFVTGLKSRARAFGRRRWRLRGGFFLSRYWIDLEAFDRRIGRVHQDHVAFANSSHDLEPVAIVPPDFDFLQVHGMIGADQRDLRPVGSRDQAVARDQQRLINPRGVQVDLGVHTGQQRAIGIGHLNFHQQRARVGIE